VLCLGIETSSRRGSVALVDGGRLIARAEHSIENAHAEQLRPLLDRVLADAGQPKHAILRVAVGMGPGSFTGLRVGIAFAEGIALGLGVPWLGVGSLRAMATLLPKDREGLRVTLLDARRDEIFVAAYTTEGAEVWAPRAVARAEVARVVQDAPSPRWVLGEVASSLGLEGFRSPETDLPDAFAIALLGETLDPAASIDEPQYVRDAGATPQALPPSPFDS
jgi:tRNA threonylcarbamoyl adenosine modification protein YeaZ